MLFFFYTSQVYRNAIDLYIFLTCTFTELIKTFVAFFKF